MCAASLVETWSSALDRAKSSLGTGDYQPRLPGRGCGGRAVRGKMAAAASIGGPMRQVVAAAVVVFGAAVARADQSDEALQRMDQGMALFRVGSLTAARAAFVEAQKLVPDKANPYRWLGLTDARLGRCADAAEELDAFIKRVPADD